jgi:hypothetical protein
LLLLHAFGALGRYPIYDLARDGGWYQFGFLIGAGSPFLGVFGRKAAADAWRRRRCSS